MFNFSVFTPSLLHVSSSAPPYTCFPHPKYLLFPFFSPAVEFFFSSFNSHILLRSETNQQHLDEIYIWKINLTKLIFFSFFLPTVSINLSSNLQSLWVFKMCWKCINFVYCFNKEFHCEEFIHQITNSSLIAHNSGISNKLKKRFSHICELSINQQKLLISSIFDQISKNRFITCSYCIIKFSELYEKLFDFPF